MNAAISASEAEIFVTVIKVLCISSQKETLRVFDAVPPPLCRWTGFLFERPLRGVAAYQFQLHPQLRVSD